MNAGTGIQANCCPLCGADNSCAVAGGGAGDSCWCADQTFPQALQPQENLSARAAVCVCQDCLDKVREAAYAG